MTNVKRVNSSGAVKRSRPALTPEARENQLIAKAVDLAERQIEDGSASSQIVVHFLKLGTEKTKLEIERLKQENKLMEAKTEQLLSAKRQEELFAEAISAMRSYRGEPEVGEEYD